jgi:hypothetical protein
MEWNGYQISLRLLSPLHIGWRKSGNLQQTRPYVTGRALWGALTARLTRDQQHDNYKTVGDQVDEQLAFTYFYPSDIDDRVRLWPWGEEWDEFAWTYLNSYVSTALEDGHAAEEGSLHETEFISPRTRDGKQVYLIGYVLAQDDCQLNWLGALSRLQLGGERGYGWGRMVLQLDRDKKSIGKDSPCFKDFKLANGTDNPILEVTSSEAKLLAHAIADINEVAGEIEPLVGRETDPTGRFGHLHSKPKVCWKPGKSVSKGDKFSIGCRGLWEKITR